MNSLCAIQIGSRLSNLLRVGGILLISGASFSQGLYNEAEIHIDGAAVFIDGSVHNNGLVINEGILGFAGDWESDGHYKGSGVLDAYGQGTQRIFHYGHKVSSLFINGPGAKYIKGEISVTGALRLNSGIVHVSYGDVLRLTEGALISGGSTDSYVDGAITAEGTVHRFFPIGKNGIYAPIEFIEVIGKSPEYSIEVFDHAPLISLEDVIVRNGLYWQRKDLAGTFIGSRIGIHYEPRHFRDRDNMIMVAGIDWENPFQKLTEVDHSGETDQLRTRTATNAPILMLGEISTEWDEADFYLSTALSPNAVQAVNRAVKIFGERLSDDEFHFAVFDRRGNIVYQSTSLESMATNGWDGRSITGTTLVSGTYPYRLTAVDKTGKRFEKKGVITLIY